MPSFRLTLSYDGTDFAGSQVQPDQRTVQGELDRALAAFGAPGRSVFAGRTDRGVHAVGQVVAVRLASWRGDDDAFARALGARLPDDVAIVSGLRCGEAFHPRFDATWREYRFWIAPGVVSPFLRRYAWLPRAPVDVAAMADGAQRLVGVHDFASFASGGEGVPWSERAQRPRGTVRHLLRCECRERFVHPGPGVEPAARVLEIRVVADAFLPRMVRNISGALVEVGQGRQQPEWIEEILRAKDRRLGSVVAPPHGLTLWRVGYKGDELEAW